jgi:hypothetical protein
LPAAPPNTLWMSEAVSVDLWWSKGFDGGFMVDFMVDLFGYDDDLHWYLLYW